MLLAFDVGNSNTVLGVFKDGELLTNWRIETDTRKSADEYGMLLKQLFDYEKIDMSEIDDMIISTVVPSVLFTLQHMAVKYFGKQAIVVASGVKTGLIVKYDNPKQVGADRIVNAVAAIHKYGGPLILVDLGTATTFCAITDKGEYLGGTIAPGLKISSEALFEKTSKLPKLVYGHMGICDYIVRKMKKEMQEYVGDKKITVVATGGFSALIDSGVGCIDYVDKLLTLEGLEIIYQKNKRLPRHNCPKVGEAVNE